MKRNRIQGHNDIRLLGFVQGQLCLCAFVFCFILSSFLTTSCSSEGTIEDENNLDLRQPMVFGTSSSSENVVTKAPLESTNTTFKVNTWKEFGTAEQTVVMDGYEVDYTAVAKTDAPDTYNWYYEGINSQILRYWDLSAFPYEFRAVSPYLSGAAITDAGISVNLATDSKAFQAQSLINDAYNLTDAAAQPCVVAHVNRVKDGINFKDTDIIKSSEINTDGKTNATREVHLPFHHLNSKVGFRIFIDEPEPPYVGCNAVIKSINIVAQNSTAPGFITASTQYTATNAQGLANGTFSNNTAQTTEFTLLRHGEYTGVNLCDHLTHNTAYDLSTNCMQQIPQSNVKIKVDITIDVDGLDQSYTNWLSLTDVATGDNFTWTPDNKYIYYLHIKGLRGGKIFLDTCEILPWDEVQTTDITIEM